MTSVTTDSPYADGHRLYLEAGWTGVLPVCGKAGNLPVGKTGREGIDPTAEELCHWAEHRAQDNLALRLPPGVVGFDVDAYKRGAETFKRAVQEWGPLPGTWRSTARAEEDSLSGIYLYRVPEGVELKSFIEFDGVSDLEICQHHHRFQVAWPSIHPDTGNRYEWSHPNLGGAIPTVGDIPLLPDRWLDGLRAPAPLAEHPPVDVEPQYAPREFWDALVLEQFEELRSAALGEAGSRHDHARDAIMALARSERRGKTGATSALEEAPALWVELMGGERENGQAGREVADLISGGRKLAATTPTTAVEPETLEWMDTLSVPDHVDAETGEVTAPEAPAKPPSMRDEVLSVSELMEREPPQPLIDGVLYRHSSAIVTAPPKTGKTFLTLSMGFHVAAGIPWFGQKIPKRGKVLYVLGEGVAGAATRVQAWVDEHPELRDRVDENLHFMDRAVVLRDPMDVMALLEMAEAEQYDLIILDTFARAAVGLEENSAKEMGQAIAVLDRLKVVSDACVLLVHHTGKDTARGMRGSSALAGALDTSLVVEGDLSNLIVKTDFQKDAAGDWQVQLRSRRVGQSLILEKSDIVFESTKTDDQALEVLRWGGVPISRSEWIVQCLEDGMARSSAYRSVGRLISSGQVDSPDGLDNKGARFMVRGPDAPVQ